MFKGVGLFITLITLHIQFTFCCCC